MHSNNIEMIGNRRLINGSLGLLFAGVAISIVVVSILSISNQNKKNEYNLCRRINVNTAQLATLEMLPTVGASTARRIVEFRESLLVAHKNFEKPADLGKIKGIGDAKIERISPYICFE